jgi:hypothetical protein
MELFIHFMPDGLRSQHSLSIDQEPGKDAGPPDSPFADLAASATDPGTGCSCTVNASQDNTTMLHLTGLLLLLLTALGRRRR